MITSLPETAAPTVEREIPLYFHPRPVRTLGERYFPILAGIAIVLFAVIVNIVLQDYIVTWDGLMPVDGHCGDYCGTDAGLITEPAR